MNLSHSSTANILNILAGLWLIISPFIIGPMIPAARINDIVIGVIVGLIGLVRTFNHSKRITWLDWVSAIVGVWLIVAPFFLSYPTSGQMWNSVLLGVIVLIFSVWSTMSDRGSRAAAF